MTTSSWQDEPPFPSSPPSDLDDPAAITAHDWAAFRGLERMKDHWDRAHWHRGYRAYYWMLTFPNTPELVKMAALCQEALAPLRMDNVPEDGLHVTMTKIGDTAKIDHNAVENLADQALGSLPSSFVMGVHPLTASRGAVRCSVTPWTPLTNLHQALTEIGTSTGMPGGRPTTRFRPHLGVAYSNREQPTDPVTALISPLRTLTPVNVRITSVDLVELRREDNAYRWDVIRSLPLKASHQR